MAALGKIRKRGVILVIIIGLGLFAFIAEEMFRSCEATKNERNMQVGEVLGKKISVQKFQDMLEEYEQVMRITRGTDNFSEAEMNQLKDQVWNIYVNGAILEAEAKKVGLTVTDEELQNIMKEGTNPILLQSPFVDQQTGRFDVTMLTKFLADYNKMVSGGQTVNSQALEYYENINTYWTFIEKNLRQQVLGEKYQTLLTSCLISNPIAAKRAFEDQNIESSIELAALPYSTISDNDVEVTAEEVKALYDKRKEAFKQVTETRDIKYVDFQVKASAADRIELSKNMKVYADSLKAGADPAVLVRKAQSDVAYLGIPQTAKAFPVDIRRMITDSLSVGETSAPFETKRDNTFNVVKLISKVQQPDSVEFRQINVAGATIEEARQTADSIYHAIKGGANFEDIAQIYGQTGQSQWMTSAMYENASTIDNDTKQYIQALNTLSTNEVKNIELPQGNIIIQVTARKAFTEKYVAAVVKRSIDFTKTTYSDAYNKFSQYVSESQTIEDLEANAKKYGFTVRERNDVQNSEHYVAGVRSTREAMKWIFDAKEGKVSPLYECGDNDHLLVVALTKIHHVGYRDVESTAETLRPEVIRDKKFEAVKAKLDGVKSLKNAETKGATLSTVDQVTFSAPVFVKASGASEPALSGAIAATKEGELCPRIIKGNTAAYMFSVTKKTQREGAEYDEAAMKQQLSRQAAQAANRFLQELYSDAKVVDNRYLFF